MIDCLQLREDDALADLGCGTGMYALDILRQVPLRRPIIGVDPFAEMLEQIPEGCVRRTRTARSSSSPITSTT